MAKLLPVFLGSLCLSLQLQQVRSWSSYTPFTSRQQWASARSSSTNVGRNPTKSMRPTSILNSVAVPLPDDTSATEVAPSVETPKVLTTKEQLWQKARTEGGRFSFNTKYGALNPYAIYYGLTSIFLGLFWYVALTGIHFLYFITRGRIDKRVSRIMASSILKVTMASCWCVFADDATLCRRNGCPSL
jgi:hypothetical protein